MRDPLRQFVVKLGEALRVFLESEVGLATPAQIVLGGDQFERDGPVAGQFRVAGQILFDASGLPGFQAQFQVDVHQLDQHPQSQRIVLRQKVIDRGPGVARQACSKRRTASFTTDHSSVGGGTSSGPGSMIGHLADRSRTVRAGRAGLVNSRPASVRADAGRPPAAGGRCARPARAVR